MNTNLHENKSLINSRKQHIFHDVVHSTSTSHVKNHYNIQSHVAKYFMARVLFILEINHSNFVYNFLSHHVNIKLSVIRPMIVVYVRNFKGIFGNKAHFRYHNIELSCHKNKCFSKDNKVKTQQLFISKRKR